MVYIDFELMIAIAHISQIKFRIKMAGCGENDDVCLLSLQLLTEDAVLHVKPSFAKATAGEAGLTWLTQFKLTFDIYY